MQKFFNDFFIYLLQVEFHSTKKSFINVAVSNVVDADSGAPVKFSNERALLVERYEVV